MPRPSRVALALALAAACEIPAPSSATPTSRSYRDDGGRTISLPLSVKRVLPAGPPASIDLIMIAPEKLIGLTTALTADQKTWLPPAAADLPSVGRLTGRGNTVNLEKFLASSPDLAVDVGYVGGAYLSLADRVQGQTDVPYALIDGSLTDTPSTLRRIGDLVGEEGRANTLADYAENDIRLVRSRIEAIAPDRRLRVYLARGPSGLETAVAGSINSEVLDLVGGLNVATPVLGSRGVADVSPEQLLSWQPDVIIVEDPAFYKAIWNDPRWRQLSAVRDKRVYLAPSLPFGWIDEPPAANRLIGLRWLAQALYPSLFPEDLRAEVKKFYALFYQDSPSAPQLDQLLAGALAPP